MNTQQNAVGVDIIIIYQFTRLKMHLLRSAYPNLLEMGKSGKGAIFLDIGSCSENHGIITATRRTNPKTLTS